MPWFLIIGGVLVVAYIATRTPPVNVSKNLSKSLADNDKEEKKEDTLTNKKRLVFSAVPSVSKEDTIKTNDILNREIESYVYKMMIAYKVSVEKGNYDQRFEKIWNIFIFNFKPIYNMFPPEIKEAIKSWETFLMSKDKEYNKKEYGYNFSALQSLIKKRMPYGDYWPVGLDLLNVKTGKKIPFIPHI